MQANAADGNWCDVAVFSGFSSSGLYNRWNSSVVEYDSETGVVTVDMDGNGSIDAQGTVAAAYRAAVTSVGKSPARLDIGKLPSSSIRYSKIQAFKGADYAAGETPA